MRASRSRACAACRPRPIDTSARRRRRKRRWKKERVRALACPASLKGVLDAAAAAAALGEGLRRGGADALELPVADGGEGTEAALHRARGGRWHEAVVVDAFGCERRARWLVLPEATAVVEAAEAIPLDPSRPDPLAAS